MARRQNQPSRKASKQKSKNNIRLGGFIILIIVGIIASACVYVAFDFMTVNVVVATQTIQGNTKITSDMVTTKSLGKGSLPDNYISAGNLNAVVGSYTNVGITSGSVFTTGNVASAQSRKSAAITEGYTRMNISANNIPSGIQTDDRVNILIEINLSDTGKCVMTYQNILVTGVKSNSSGDTTGLEVEVTPEQAQQIQYAESNGNLSVTLLPTGYEEQNLDATDEDSIENFSTKDSSSKSKNSSYLIDNSDD